MGDASNNRFYREPPMTQHQTPPSVPTDEMVEAAAAAEAEAYLATNDRRFSLRAAVTAALAAMPGGVERKWPNTICNDIDKLLRRYIRWERGDQSEGIMIVGWRAAARAVEEYIAALTPSAIGAEGWRAIESAPKDGAHLLLRVKPFTWNGGGFKADVTMTGYWDEMDGAWCGTTSNWDGPFVEPFAWQPLPTPPTAQEGK